MELERIEPQGAGRFLSRYDLYYALADGGGKRYEMVSRAPISEPADVPGRRAEGVVMIVLNGDGTRLLLNREFRPAVNKTVYNFPAGLIEPGETPGQAARRELWEETGLHMTALGPELGRSYGAVGISNESAAVCFCRADDAEPFAAHHEAAEEIEPCWVGREQAAAIVCGGAVTARVQLFLALWAGLAGDGLSL